MGRTEAWVLQLSPQFNIMPTATENWTRYLGWTRDPNSNLSHLFAWWVRKGVHLGGIGLYFNDPVWILDNNDSLAESSKAPDLGSGPKGRGFKSHSCHLYSNRKFFTHIIISHVALENNLWKYLKKGWRIMKSKHFLKLEVVKFCDKII